MHVLKQAGGSKWGKVGLIFPVKFVSYEFLMVPKQERNESGAIIKREGSITRGAFRGNFTHSLDDKGRINLPSEFRRLLQVQGDQSVVLTNYISDGARCLEGFGVSAWEEFESKLREKSRFSPKLQKLENFYLSRASECPIDSSGRILIPSYLRAYGGIEREVTFTSSIHGFRMWDRRVWETIFSQAEQALLDNPEVFGDVDI